MSRSSRAVPGRPAALLMAAALPVGLLVALLLALPGAAAAQTTYIAFGDSITFGVGEDGDGRLPPENGGYPIRLEEILTAQGQNVEVRNEGIPGETTFDGLSRIGQVLNRGGDVLLLMEGTNDINAGVSIETVRDNLDAIASRAENRGVEAIHATIIPRQPSANFDGNNSVALALSGQIRDLAWSTDRRLVDPFEVLINTDNVFSTLYAGGDDRLHLNGQGYQVLAQTFADVLLGNDTVPPVVGIVFPEDDQQRVLPTVTVAVDLYDFGAGIDITNTRLLINDQPVQAELNGDSGKLEIRYTPAEPFVGVVFVGIETRDLASPTNAVRKNLVQFVINGTRFFAGDIDRDGRVDGADLVAFAVRFGSTFGDGRYRLFADFNGDGFIDGVDLSTLASNFGQTSF